MGHPQPLSIYNRHAQRIETEWMPDHQLTYETRPRTSVLHFLQSHPWVDRIVSAYKHSALSARDIAPFIARHRIDMRDFEPHNYRCFAEFFLRRFRPGARTFVRDPDKMPAFSEARYFAWERLTAEERFPVKGASLDAVRLLGSEARARPFHDGPALLVRLSPLDYHHVHYPDDGRTLESYRLGGRTNTVNWRAVRNKPDIYFENERQVSLLDTRNFGRVAFVEIGALTVGKVAQVHDPAQPFERGQEKSFFRFGGSAIMVLGEPGVWRPTDDLLAHTREGIETLVRLGEMVATRSLH
jgi:phosphatidylserine decarboxylase